jgi:hypothetical protein
MRTCLTQAPDRIAKKSDELLLGTAAEAFGHVGHDGLGGVVYLPAKALVVGKWQLQ